MSSPKSLVVVALLLALGACGFRPMYGKSSADPAVATELASISVKPIPERAGQLLHNALLTRLNPKGEPVKARYVLDTTLAYSETQEAVMRDDNATRNLVTYVAQYRLYLGPTPVAQGRVTKEVSYDFLQQHYSDISAQSDVERHAADLMADEIRQVLSAYFIRAAEVRRGELQPQPQR